jgi:hypothetical protein
MSVTDELAQMSLTGALRDVFGAGSPLLADVLNHIVRASVVGLDSSDSQMSWARAAKSCRALALYCKEQEEACR